MLPGDLNRRCHLEKGDGGKRKLVLNFACSSQKLKAWQTQGRHAGNFFLHEARWKESAPGERGVRKRNYACTMKGERGVWKRFCMQQAHDVCAVTAFGAGVSERFVGNSTAGGAVITNPRLNSNR
jgi:hypothetical protein